MTYARSEVFDPSEVGVYHCVSRCVRRAFLCGKDSLSGKSFEHRRAWIKERLGELSEVFAIEVISYAVMSNHLHCLIRTRPDLSEQWSDQEVAARWRTLFPYRRERGKPATPSKAEIEAITEEPKLVSQYRSRLSDLSWFNRCLNENIAKRSNKEDECSGRFWEGRFKCQRVHDISGIVACSAYIDLNPIRAGISKTLEGSDYTSVQQRIHKLKGRRVSKGRDEISLVPLEELSEGGISTADYLELVEETGRVMRDGKGKISDNLEPILSRLKISSENWISTTRDFKDHFRRMVGPVESLKRAAKKAKKSWFHGLGTAKLAFC